MFKKLINLFTKKEVKPSGVSEEYKKEVSEISKEAEGLLSRIPEGQDDPILFEVSLLEGAITFTKQEDQTNPISYVMNEEETLWKLKDSLEVVRTYLEAHKL